MVQDGTGNPIEDLDRKNMVDAKRLVRLHYSIFRASVQNPGTRLRIFGTFTTDNWGQSLFHKDADTSASC
jgi:hypothetical protein